MPTSSNNACFIINKILALKDVIMCWTVCFRGKFKIVSWSPGHRSNFCFNWHSLIKCPIYHWKDYSQCAKHLKKENPMAILLVVLPNSCTILDPSKPKTCPGTTVEPPGWWPLLILFRKSSPLFLIQALMNYIPVKFQRSKWRHLLSNSKTEKGNCF